MTSLGLVSDDVLVPMRLKESLVVQVERLTALSPLTEPQEMESLSAAAEADIAMVETVQEETFPVLLTAKEGQTSDGSAQRSRTSPSPSPSPRLQRSTSLGLLTRGRDGNRSPTRRKDIGLRLPSFKGLGISSLDPKHFTRNAHNVNQKLRSELLPETQRPERRLRPFSVYHHASEPHFGSTPLLTPPEDTYSIKWNNALLHTSASSNSRCTQHGRHSGHADGITTVSMTDTTSGGSSGIPGQQEQTEQGGNMSDPGNQRAQDNGGNNQAWLDQAIEEAGMYIRIHGPLCQAHETDQSSIVYWHISDSERHNKCGRPCSSSSS